MGYYATWHSFIQSGQIKYEDTLYGGVQYTSGIISLGASIRSDFICTHRSNPNIDFMEIVVYNYGFSLATQESIMRSQQSVFNPRNWLKKWALASYALRMVNQSHYSGAAVKVRRSGDNALGLLYFDCQGVESALFDVSSSTNLTQISDIYTWVGGVNIYVQTWFD